MLRIELPQPTIRLETPKEGAFSDLAEELVAKLGSRQPPCRVATDDIHEWRV